MKRLKHLTPFAVRVFDPSKHLRSGVANLLVRKKVAFTLAEVLITLGVIGVVASLTMPTLIQNHKEKVLITQNKVAYSTVKQALERVRADNEFWLDSVFNPNNTSLESLQAFARYFKGAKVLKRQTVYLIKLMRKEEASDGKYARSSMGANRIALANGVLIQVTQYTCQPVEYTGYRLNADGSYARDENGERVAYTYINQHCASLKVDVNGAKSPNQLGRDVFVVWVNTQDYNFLKSNWGGDVENIVSQEKFSDRLQDYDLNANFGE